MVIPSLPILIMMTSLMKGSSTTIVMALVLAMFCMGLAQPADPVHGAEHQERDFIHTARFSRRKHAADCRHGNSSLCAYLVSLKLYECHPVCDRVGIQPCGAGAFPGNLVSLGNMIQWARSYNAIFNKRYLWIGAPIVATVILFIGLFFADYGL